MMLEFPKSEEEEEHHKKADELQKAVEAEKVDQGKRQLQKTKEYILEQMRAEVKAGKQ